MLNDLQSLAYFPVTWTEILTNITVALLCSLTVAWLYRVTHKGPGYSVNFAHSIVLLAMITSVVIMVIGNNLARAFGLVGAMSIIRFRTAVKETRDIVFIFFGLSVGMAAGVGYHKIAIMGTVFIGLILVLFARMGVSDPTRKEYLLQFMFTPNGSSNPAYLPILKRHCRKHKVINVQSMTNEDTLELSYYVLLRDEQRDGDFVRELKATDGVSRINLFFDEERF
ncbi:MAG: DUF4956 domain-containing protein [candidate division Zixibacteria bacterium]|nr:DUF4956 domain-containing protein [candidate division Zixibacteria bacterium]